MIDLKALSLAELNNLVADIQVEIGARKNSERNQLLAEFKARASQLGIDLNDLVTGKIKHTKVNKVAAKYVHPLDPAMTWTGRGRQPRWVVELLANGKTMDDLRV